MKKLVNLIANSLTLLLISIKRNNVANPNLIKHSCRAHTTLRQVLAQLFHTEQRLVHGFWIAQLCLLLSALTRKASLLYWNGHICCSSSEAEIVFLPGLTESDCAVGALNSDVIFQCLESERSLESWFLSSYTMPQVAETWRSGRLGDWTIRSFGWENQRSIICQVLGNDYPMASLLCSFFCVLPRFPPLPLWKQGVMTAVLLYE